MSDPQDDLFEGDAEYDETKSFSLTLAPSKGYFRDLNIPLEAPRRTSERDEQGSRYGSHRGGREGGRGGSSSDQGGRKRQRSQSPTSKQFASHTSHSASYTTPSSPKRTAPAPPQPPAPAPLPVSTKPKRPQSRIVTERGDVRAILLEWIEKIRGHLPESELSKEYEIECRMGTFENKKFNSLPPEYFPFYKKTLSKDPRAWSNMQSRCFLDLSFMQGEVQKRYRFEVSKADPSRNFTTEPADHSYDEWKVIALDSCITKHRIDVFDWTPKDARKNEWDDRKKWDVRFCCSHEEPVEAELYFSPNDSVMDVITSNSFILDGDSVTKKTMRLKKQHSFEYRHGKARFELGEVLNLSDDSLAKVPMPSYELEIECGLSKGMGEMDIDSFLRKAEDMQAMCKSLLKT